MRAVRTPISAATAVVALAALAGGCVSDSSGGGASDVEATPGGTLYYLTRSPADTMDPQRTYLGRDLSNFNRLLYRGLVTLPVTEDAEEGYTPVPDVATDTGRMSEDARTWEFTIRDGVRWEDGRDVTCGDFKYGISRTFATDVITGGPNYILSYLDIPKDDSGLPIYNGPYKGDHQADYDKAVTCDGSTLTLHFGKPWPDFNYAVASLLAFGPYRADKDQGERSTYQMFSNGPYKLEGRWDAGVGGTFVRNPEYDPASDESGTRQANPDKIVYTQGLENEVIYERLIADVGKDQYAVTDRSCPPAYFSEMRGDVGDRTSQVDSPYVHYLVPNFTRMKSLEVRRALMLSTDVTAWRTVNGGDRAGTPAHSIINPALIGSEDNPNFTAPPEGDPVAARVLLEQSGEKLPYRIKYTFPGGTPTSEKAAAALAEGWKKAGFAVTLEPLLDTYADVTSRPSADFDVTSGSWGADWPSIATVIPPLFDSRINLTAESNGLDSGNYRSDVVNRMIDEAALTSDVDEQAAKYIEIDDQLGKDVAYIPLDIGRFYFLHGSKVTGYLANPAAGGFPDLGGIGVEHP